MRLTLHTDHALRLLLYLALEPERVSTISEIAAAYGISRHHLEKVARRLALLGHVESTRGRNGGLRLGRPADQINTGAVIRETEPDLDLVACFHPTDDSCPIDGLCALKGALQEARGAFLNVLDRLSLADLLRGSGQLGPVLGLVPLRAPAETR